MREVGDRIKELDDRLKGVDEQLGALLMTLPNLPHASVPAGKDSAATLADNQAMAAAFMCYEEAYARFSECCFSGSSRMRCPVAAKIAFSTAGAATAMVGSPTPPQKPPEGITMVSTLGMCRMCTTG